MYGAAHGRETRGRSGVIPAARLAQCADLALLRLMVTGESVVDLPRLWFMSRPAVEDFVRLCGLNLASAADGARLREMRQRAVAFLCDTHSQRLPAEVLNCDDVGELLLMASQARGRLRRSACMVLKVMHIIHHLTGREQLLAMPMAESELYSRISAKTESVVARMRGAGIGVVEFAGGQKPRDSLITKLLAKRSTLASQIFDRVRFRLIVETRDDLVRALLYLAHHLCPFNYVIPEQSHNAIVTAADVARVLDLPLTFVRPFWGTLAAPHGSPNEFSGRTYRCVNFAADIPLRIEDVAPVTAPAVLFVQTELQLMDAASAASNERGENNHQRYKRRQVQRVRQRLAGPRDDALTIAYRAHIAATKRR
jgi:uncharacterized protein (TIGR04552 family)